MKGLAKIAQYFGRRDDDELLETIGMSLMIKCFRELMGESLFSEVVPVYFLHGAPQATGVCGGSARTIRALFTCRRVVSLENALNNKFDALCVAFVAQEKSLLTIADENQTIMGNLRSRFPSHFDCAPNRRCCHSNHNAEAVARFPCWRASTASN